MRPYGLPHTASNLFQIYKFMLHRPSVRPRGTTRHPLNGFSWSFIFDYFQESVQKIQVFLKSDKNNGRFTWRSVYIYNSISINSSWNKKCFRQNLQKNSEHIYTLIYFFPRKSCPLRDNVEIYGGAGHATDENRIRRMRTACSISKATDIYSEM